MKATPIELTKLMLVAYVSSSPTCIIHDRDDELHLLTDDGSILTPFYRFNTDPTNNAVRPKLPDSSNKQEHHYKSMKQSEEILEN